MVYQKAEKPGIRFSTLHGKLPLTQTVSVERAEQNKKRYELTIHGRVSSPRPEDVLLVIVYI